MFTLPSVTKRAFLIITTISLTAFASKNASFTCCYSAKCPLPVFKQWSEQKDILKFSEYIIWDAECCPKKCTVYTETAGRLWPETKYGINSTQFITGTLQSSCVCNCPQTCDAISDYDTCDDSKYMTDAACPDAKVDDINLIPNSTDDSHIDYKCTYDPGTGVQRPMSQRCYPDTICVARDKVDGTYTKMSSFYNGFVQYANDLYVMRIELEDSRQRWVFRLQSNDSQVTSMPILFFGIDYTNFAHMSTRYVYAGVCTLSPTREPSVPSEGPTRKPTNQPTLPTVDPTERPTTNPTPKPSAEPTEPTSNPTKKPTRNPSEPTPKPTWLAVWPAPTQRPTTYYESLFHPTTSPTKRPTVSAVVAQNASANNTLLMVVIIVLVLVVICLGFAWWRNRKQAQGLDQYQELIANQGAQPVQVQYARM